MNIKQRKIADCTKSKIELQDVHMQENVSAAGRSGISHHGTVGHVTVTESGIVQMR